MKNKPTYGIDAPSVVRNLFLFSLAALALNGLSFLISSPGWFWLAFIYTGATALSFLIGGFWMLYSSRIAKPKIALTLIDLLALQGHETVLDMGCGRGLLLVAAAKRLISGKAHGVDLWQTQDQSGNGLEATLVNARAEKVAEKIEIQTADIRYLPFADQMFDAVASSLVIHNIPDEKGRQQALLEMLRVLKPGGRFVLFDIQYGKKYAEFLKDKSILEFCKTIKSYCPPGFVIKGRIK